MPVTIQVQPNITTWRFRGSEWGLSLSNFEIIKLRIELTKGTEAQITVRFYQIIGNTSNKVYEQTLTIEKGVPIELSPAFSISDQDSQLKLEISTAQGESNSVTITLRKWDKADMSYANWEKDYVLNEIQNYYNIGSGWTTNLDRQAVIPELTSFYFPYGLVFARNLTTTGTWNLLTAKTGVPVGMFEIATRVAVWSGLYPSITTLKPDIIFYPDPSTKVVLHGMPYVAYYGRLYRLDVQYTYSTGNNYWLFVKLCSLKIDTTV